MCLSPSFVVSSSGPAPPSAPPRANGDPPPCKLHEIDVVLTTPALRAVPWRNGASAFGHISYRLDELGSEPTSCHIDCSSQVTHLASRHDGRCRCPSRRFTHYGANQTHHLRLCVAPGAHTLKLEDASGFGWLGARLSVFSVANNSQALNLTDSTGDMVTAATVPTQDCEMPCPSANDAEASCWARLFDPAQPTCPDLRSEGCDCGVCCIATASDHQQWSAAQPAASSLLWGGHQTNGTSSINHATFVFEIFPPFAPTPAVNATAPVLTEIKRETVPCSNGRSSALITGLSLEGLRGYVVGVQAIDRANNAATCGTSQYGRLTTDGIGQRAVIIDATPPHPNTTRGSVLDVASLFQPALPLPPDTDRLYARPAQIGCDWSALGFSDEHSRMTGFEWALSSDGRTDDALPWVDVGTDTYGAAQISSFEACDLHALRPPPSPPTPPHTPPAPYIFQYSPFPPPIAPPMPLDEPPSRSPASTPTVSSRCLQANVRYQCLVRAYNAAGGSTTVTSDGFWIDDASPEAGYVVDGPDPTTDLLITSEEFKFSVAWGSFFASGLEGLSYLVGFDECSKPADEVHCLCGSNPFSRPPACAPPARI